MPMQFPAKSARLMLVYNADAGLLNAARESLLKVFAPSKVACSLCALTHGIFMMHSDWRMFLNSLPLAVDEYHRDEVAARFGDLEFALPGVLIALGEGKPKVLIAADELDAMADLDELIERVQDRLVDIISRSPGLRLTD
ncbi:MAG: hypothetical protein ACX930_10095 [Erythrobacter sp.]